MGRLVGISMNDLNQLSVELARRSANLMLAAERDWRVAAWFLSFRYPERWGPPTKAPNRECREYEALKERFDELSVPNDMTRFNRSRQEEGSP